MNYTIFGSTALAGINFLSSFSLTNENVTLAVGIISSIIGVVALGVKTWFDFKNKQRDLELRIKEEELELRRKEAEYEKELNREI